MTAGPASAVARVRSTLARSDDTRTDGQLLAAFRDARDPDAFTALVYRHGPRVLGVCRRITGHDHDADDACQAVFLVLARRAADVRPPDGVGAWLYGVAVRTAQDARVMSARRRARQTPTAELPDVPTEDTTPETELAAALDAEIAELPENLRAAVVLCELDGLSRKDAAARLGIAEGTLSSRLADARKRLAAGLKRKGFALPAVLAVALPSAACGSETVFPLACRLGQLAAAGDQLPAGVPVALADVVTRVMFLHKMKLIGAVAVCGLLMLAAGWMTFGGALADEPKPADPPKAQPVPKAAPLKPVNKLLVWRQQDAYLLDPDGKNETKAFERAKFQAIRHVALSPDGKKVAFLTNALDPSKSPTEEERRTFTLAVRTLGEKDETAFKLTGQMLAWSPDGKELLVTDFADAPPNPKDGFPKSTTTIVELATKKETTPTLPAGHIATAFAPDGRRLLTTLGDFAGEKIVMAACLVSRDGKEVKTVSDPAYLFQLSALSPDGKTLLFLGLKAPDKFPDKPLDENPRLYVQPVGGKVVELPEVPENAQVQGYCWSPDGKKVAYTWRTMHKEKAEDGKPDERETESHLCVCDADGKNHKTILTEKGMGQWHITLSSVDWR